MSESEPWKDADTLRELYESRTQSEVAHYFRDQGHDVTASTISYWMKKLEVNTTHTSHNETSNEIQRECVNYESCNNYTPGPRNGICNSCLDERRGLVGGEIQ